MQWCILKRGFWVVAQILAAPPAAANSYQSLLSPATSYTHTHTRAHPSHFTLTHPDFHLRGKNTLEGLEEAEARAKRASPTASSEQCSRACRDQRKARWAIRRELPEQMSTRGADVESKARQFSGKACPLRNSSNQRAEIVR